jgi:curved DNA-binding protein CbpA
VTSHEHDYYALLGVGRGASAADVDRAYRRAARATHPDLHPNDGSAADRFRAVTLAYETLSDPARRASYDHGRSPTGPGARVRIVVQPAHTRPTVPHAADLLEFVETFARMIGARPFG